ncbi:Protein of unknown function (plasmid) [Azospirillum lipoferum 4B]|uniref:Uncharacterized protein n=1 Tax=Azospirillum lipoferum (strain 4B) TaxID=862719 RepID=G7ZI49_AZOL4|nr:Protein of unknown function [Azospirillum lipoferum 4B]
MRKYDYRAAQRHAAGEMRRPRVYSLKWFYDNGKGSSRCGHLHPTQRKDRGFSLYIS